MRISAAVGFCRGAGLDGLLGLAALTGSLLGTFAMLSGIALLRLAWGRRDVRGRAARLSGWALIVAGGLVFGSAWGGELGAAIATLVFSALAFAVVAIGVEVRKATARAERGLALEPESRPTNWPRAIAKSLLAIVLAGIAAVGIGIAFAVMMPINPTDRIVIGGILVPILWGGGMAWTLSDAKLVRATLLLVLISLLSYGMAFMPKVMAS